MDSVADEPASKSKPTKATAKATKTTGHVSVVPSGLASGRRPAAAAGAGANATVVDKGGRPKSKGAVKSAAVAPKPAEDVAAAPRNPLPTLYSDLMHIIYSYCRLRDLAALLHVSKHWASAVDSMPPLLASHSSNPPFKRICESRMGRHLGELLFIAPPGIPTATQLTAGAHCTSTLLAAFTAHLTNLTALQWSFPEPAAATKLKPAGRWPTTSEVEAYNWPAKLRKIELTFPSPPRAMISSVFQSVAKSCPSLTKMYVSFHARGSENHLLRFSPLSQLKQLRTLVLHDPAITYELELSADQIADLRDLPALEFLDVRTMCAQRLIQPMLQGNKAVTPLRWKSLPAVGPYWTVADALADLIVESLPALTSLGDASFEETELNRLLMKLRMPVVTDIGDVSFVGSNLNWLKRLPELTELSLRLRDCPMAAAGAEGIAALLPGLQSCVNLTRLAVMAPGNSFLSPEFTAVLSCMPLLNSLTLGQLQSVHSLAFLTEVPSLALTLQNLSIDYARRPSSLDEFAAVHSLKSLRRFWLRGSFDPAPAASPRFKPFRVPSKVLPKLVEFQLLPGWRGEPMPAAAQAAAAQSAIAAEGSMAASREREAERVAAAKKWLKESKAEE